MRTRARWSVLLLVLLLLGSACGGDGGEVAGDDPEGDVLVVRAGMNDADDPTIAVTEYLPESVTVSPGTTVRWKLDGPEPHSVTFMPTGQTPPPPNEAEPLFAPTAPEGPVDGSALVNSGLVPLGPDPATFEVSFDRPGTFTYSCVIHPLMTGTVTVVDGATGDTQEEIDARAEGELEKWLEEGRAAKAALTGKELRKETTGATTVWYVDMGATTEHTDVLAFQPAKVDVAAGDAVVFVNDSLAPHTATFAGEAGTVPDPGSPEEAEVVPGPSPVTLNAADYFNTGMLPPNAPPGAGPPEAVRSFRFDVAEGGEYAFVCILHRPSGMVGTISAT